tara:strand:- start:25187 stop:26053 length:867 start_codon:yes stop_codon:yes gene_type:complete
VGAPKCGTTSLYRYLKSHQNIVMSNPKEPHYFSRDINNGGMNNLEKYLKCFSKSNSDCGIEAVGEASTMYLYSKVAIKNILKFNSDAKFIVMLRNPIEIAYSFHQTALKVFGETEVDFIRAWDLQDQRLNGNKVPIGCLDKKLLAYGEIAKLGAQVERLLSIVNKKKIFFILFDDFIKSTEKEYLSILSFLKINSQSLPVYRTYNKTRKISSPFVTSLTNQMLGLKKKLGLSINFGIAKKIHNINQRNEKLGNLNGAVFSQLDNFFQKDIELLSKLIKKDLTQWRNKK